MVVEQDLDTELGRTHLTGYEGWPPPENIYNHLSIFADFIGDNLPDGEILDLGCGDGSISRMVATKFPNKNITAVDVESHPQWKIKSPKNLKFVQSSIYSLPYKQGAFDTLILKDVLHHLEDPETVLKKISKLASKRVLIIEANRYNPISYVRMVRVAKHNHFSQRKLRIVIGKNAKIQTFETHVWPGKLKLPGKAFDKLFSLPPFKRIRNYNLAIFEP